MIVCALGKPVVVDPKALDFKIYCGASVIKSSRRELGEATRMPVRTDGEVAAPALELVGPKPPP